MEKSGAKENSRIEKARRKKTAGRRGAPPGRAHPAKNRRPGRGRSKGASFMTEYYKIGEISKLYNIGTDSLRYYEDLGVLKPRRSENGYRMYGIGDIRTLNILQELRSIGFSIKEIKEHLENYDVAQTLDMFTEATERINQRQAELEQIKSNVLERIHELNYYLSEKNTHESIALRNLPERHILKLSEEAIRDDNFDFILKKLQSEYEDQLYIVGNGEIGSLIDGKYLQGGGYGRYEAAFYIVASGEEFDGELPAGEYLCMTVKGGYEQMRGEWDKLFEYAKREGMAAQGDGVELYLIDDHDTNEEKEFLTELQIAVSRD